MEEQRLINLHLLTGQIGKPGAGPFSLTGQPNAMGGREAGLLANQLPGYRLVEDAEHRRQMEDPLEPASRTDLVAAGPDRRRNVPRPGNAASSRPSGSPRPIRWSACPTCIRSAVPSAKAELVIVQDAYHPTETTQLAHVLLPAASWGEKEWTSTNSERMVSLQREA